jgi:hypothetical protein
VAREAAMQQPTAGVREARGDRRWHKDRGGGVAIEAAAQREAGGGHGGDGCCWPLVAGGLTSAHINSRNSTYFLQNQFVLGLNYLDHLNSI